MKLTTYKNLLKISVIGVMILIFTGTISGNGSKSALYQRLQGGYILKLHDEHVKTFDIMNVSSVSECAINCLSRECVSFTYKTSDHSCQNHHIWRDKLVIVNSNDEDGKSYITIETFDDEWMKVYSFMAGSGVAVYNAYMGKGKRSNWSLPEKCIQKSCLQFFRSTLIDTWESLPIYQVKLVIYKTGNPAVTMTFDGRNSTKTNWFTLERLLSSPWNDLNKDNIGYFSLEGIEGARRFYVSKPHPGCEGDYGWLCITERQHVCPWENVDSYPYILYSNQRKATHWSTKHGVGDSVAIFIKLI